MAIKFQFRRATASGWAALNPILADGEPGLETDTQKAKVGNGSVAWNSLSYNFVGPQGIQGAKGDKGDVGATGEQGPIGQTGAQGSQGEIGPQGLQGNPGVKGDTGEAGGQGPPGEKGETGNTGSQGLPGQDSTVPGPQGIPGEKGEQGDQGIQGFPGADSTVPGPKGDKGDAGDDGPQGAKGDTGDVGPAGTTSWNGLTDKPSTFPPSTHGHSISDTSGLQTALDGKSGTGHGHAIGDTTGLQTELDGKSTTGHTHTIANVTNLQTSLDGKEAANANIQTHVGSAHAPSSAQKNSDITKAEIEAKLTGEISTHTHAGGGGGLGYCLNVQAASQSTTTDGQTLYWGGMPVAPNTTANRWRVYIPKSGTIKAAYIYSYSGTAGTAEAWVMNIRKNNTTDTQIASLAVATSDRVWSNVALSIAVVAGDYIEIKEVQPTWATNPATVTRCGQIYIE